KARRGGARPSGNRPAVPQSGIDGRLDAVVGFPPFPILRRREHDVVDLTELRGIEVVEPTELVPSATRQPGIRRYRDTERIEVGRRDAQIVGDGEVAVPGAEIPGGQADAGSQLVLENRARLPVVAASPEAFQHVR